ncbi:Non-histone chromosomal protein 6 [Thoreauomyces humboldtii]|nr:Non-histone chromosomal protein 6 [Thoreauomyces humboldtii]
MPPKAPATRKAPTTRKTKGKKEKDPNAPKKALSAFMIFSQENRARIKEENPDATFGQLGKLLGAAWKDLNEKDKSVYEKKQEKAKAQYEIDIKKYNASGPAESAGSEADSD